MHVCTSALRPWKKCPNQSLLCCHVILFDTPELNFISSMRAFSLYSNERFFFQDRLHITEDVPGQSGTLLKDTSSITRGDNHWRGCEGTKTKHLRTDSLNKTRQRREDLLAGSCREECGGEASAGRAETLQNHFWIRAGGKPRCCQTAGCSRMIHDGVCVRVWWLQGSVDRCRGHPDLCRGRADPCTA